MLIPEMDMIMGTNSQGNIPQNLQVDAEIIVEKTSQAHDEEQEILGDWMFVSKKKRGPKNQVRPFNEGKDLKKESANPKA